MPDSSAAPKRTLRIGFVARAVALLALLAVLIIPFAMGYLLMVPLTLPGCGGGGNPADLDLPFEDVSFPSSEFDRPTPAYFIPAAESGVPNGGTVIVMPTGSAARGDRLYEIQIYHEAGFQVLTYSSRACVAPVSGTLGSREAGQIPDALAYLAARPDVDMNRVGVHGFSAGGAAAILAAARYPALRAVVAEGNYADFPAQVEVSTPANFGILSLSLRLGAQVAYRQATGEDWSRLSPITAIASIPPRKIMLIYGTLEPGLDGGRRMAEIAHADLWVIPGAVHGGYLGVAYEEYVARVPAFMRAALQ